jgi:hypothetical protein
MLTYEPMLGGEVMMSHTGRVMDGKFIAYYRVSTDRQGMNGNGMAAQRKVVED